MNTQVLKFWLVTILAGFVSSDCFKYICPAEGQEITNTNYCMRKTDNEFEIEVHQCKEECQELSPGWALCLNKREETQDFQVSYPGERCDGSDSICRFGPRKYTSSTDLLDAMMK